MGQIKRKLLWDPMDQSVPALTVKHLIQTFKNLGMAVVAEGVETEEQRRMVVDFGVELIQEYYYSKTLLGQEMKALMRANQVERMVQWCSPV